MATAKSQSGAPNEAETADQTPRVAPIDRRSLNLPNLITVSRLGLAGFLFLLIDQTEQWLGAACLFVFAASTDAVDGYVARKYGQVTTLGRILDPFVDKIIVCGTFVFLQANQELSGVTPWMVTIVVGREMFVSSLRGFLEQQGLDFSADWAGKIKMILQCIAVTASLLSMSPQLEAPSLSQLRDILLWSAVGVTAYSGVSYVFRAARMLKKAAEAG